MDIQQIKYVVEAALLAAGRPLDLNELCGLFGDADPPGRDDIRRAITALQEDYTERGIAVLEVASGFRIQVRSAMAGWLAKLWEERAPRYSRALMETLAIIAYRQPVTRGDVEEIRGVGVTTNIMRTLLERGWIRVVGFRDVPGKPAMYGTTREFLDYFGLRRLDELPPLADLKDMEALTAQLDLSEPQVTGDEPPGAVHPLIGPPTGLPDEPASVTTITGLRGAGQADGDAAEDGAPDAHPGLPDDESAEAHPPAAVIPLKAR